MNDPKVRAHCSENLKAVIKEVETLIENVRPNVVIDEESFRTRMAHVYWHLNLAWNCRNQSAREIDAEYYDQENYFAEKYPEDLRPWPLETDLQACCGVFDFD